MDATDENKRPGTRVFKKTSPSGKLTVYLGKRDFIDHISCVDPIDGVVLVDKECLESNKVLGHVLAAFRYGREDLDVLGITFRKDLYLASEEIYPREKGAKEIPLTKLQKRLLQKLGPDAHPFLFELPPNSPSSVTLQPASTDSGSKPCGVDYELAIMLKSLEREEKAHKRNSVKLAIRKITYAPERQLGTNPSIEVFKEFVMSPNKLHLEVSLDKELYYHDETIGVNVHVANNSNRSVRKVKVSIRQFAEICLFSTAQYKCTVAEIESDESCPVQPGFTLSKIYYLKPTLDNNNREKRGLALDGELKHDCTHLASSTLIGDSMQKESLGIVVTYRAKVRLCLGPLGGDLVAELPFILMHPKPVEDTPSLPAPNSSLPSTEDNEENAGIDTDLIRLDTDDGDDDLIFEDFARLRLRGETDA